MSSGLGKGEKMFETIDDILFVNLFDDDSPDETPDEIEDEEEYDDGCFFCNQTDHYSLSHLEAIGG